MRDEWKKVRLGDVATIQTGVAKNEGYSGETIEIPYLRVANVQDGFLDLSEIKKIKIPVEKKNRFLLQKGDVIMTEGGDFDKLGRGTIWDGQITPCAHQNHLFVVRTDCTKLNPFFLSYLSASSYGRLYFRLSSKQSTNLASINSTQLSLFPILLPTLEEQNNIVNTISIWDSAIEKTEKLIEKKESLFNWYAKRILISGKTTKVLFSDLFRISFEKNTANQIYPALSVTKDGVVFQEEYFNKRVASDDTRSYLIARRNTFVFSGLNFWMGSVDLQTLTDIGIISPAYKVFTINSDLISYEYAHFLIRSNYMKRLLMDSSIVGASIVRRNLDMDNLLNSAIELPTLEQQSKIVEQLSIIQKDIELNKMLLNQYKLQKQGLMQKLLTGEWRIK